VSAWTLPCAAATTRPSRPPGWHLDQTQPGTLVWTLPHGRSYTTQPEPYPAETRPDFGHDLDLMLMQRQDFTGVASAQSHRIDLD
jgi:hypothetical protein